MTTAGAPGPTGSTATPTPRPGRVVAVVVAALATASLPVFLVGALATDLKPALTMDEAGIGAAVAAFFLAAAAGAVPGGVVVDRYGATVLLRAGGLLTAATSLVVAVVVSSPLGLTVALLIGGLALAAIDPAGARALTTAVPHHRHGAAFGLKEASVPTAAALAGLAVPAAAVTIGWRGAFATAAALAVTVVVVTPRRLDAGSAAPDVAPTAVSERDPPRRSHPRAVPALVLIAGSAALAGGSAAAVPTFLVPAAVSIGLAAASAGLLLAVASAVSIATRLLAGLAADRRPGSALHLMALLCVAGAVGVMGLASGRTAFVVPAAMLALGAGWGWTGLVFLAAVRVSPTRPGRAAGAVLVGLGLGGTIGPAFIGTVVATAGYPRAWTLSAVGMIAGAGLAAIAARLGR